MKKNVVLIVEGSAEICDLTISPGITVGEVMTALGLQGYFASKGPDQPFLGPKDDLYEALTEGATVYASTSTCVG